MDQSDEREQRLVQLASLLVAEGLTGEELTKYDALRAEQGKELSDAIYQLAVDRVGLERWFRSLRGHP